MRRLSTFMLVAIGLVSCSGKDYTETMRSQVKKALGSQFTIEKQDVKDYQWLTYPTDNFGIGTMYIPETPGAQPSATNFECDTWECFGLIAPQDPQSRLELQGYAAVGTGGAIKLTQQQQNDLAFGLVLPSVAETIGLSSDFMHSNGFSASLEIGKAHIRILRKGRMRTFLDGLPATDEKKKAFTDGRLVMVISDVVIDGLNVTIAPSSKTSVSAKAELDSKVGEYLAKGSKLQFSLTRSQSGSYNLVAARPVIVAVLPKGQPGPGVLSADQENEGWEDWRLRKIQSNDLN
ncbi:MAG TPA: hypothetical protein VLB76_08670 [Thermoanaerobaculia bacterium]|jgi:hypothetical protein|nr:hypothetical protein [Thermoanaerobaculia bacterium]